MNERAHTSGKAARWAGKDRVITDGRLSPASRRDWYAGWDFQDNIMRNADNSDAAARNNNIDRLKTTIRAALKNS